MRVFVSYSVSDDQLHLVSRLTAKLRRSGYTVYKSNSYSGIAAFDAIDNVDLFIGLVTHWGRNDDYFNAEFKHAWEHQIPRITLIEDGVDFEESQDENVVWFNRSNVQQAIDEVTLRRNTAVHSPLPIKKTDNTWAWVLGSAAVLSILALLSQKK